MNINCSISKSSLFSVHAAVNISLTVLLVTFYCFDVKGEKKKKSIFTQIAFLGQFHQQCVEQ